MGWLQDVFGREKVVLASVYLPPLPGSPRASRQASVATMVASVSQEVAILRAGGVDGVIFGNQHDVPYCSGVGPETVALATEIISRVADAEPIPFGISLFWDVKASLAVARAVGARFVRGVFSGAYAGEMGLWQVDAGTIMRYRDAIGAGDVKAMFFVRPIYCRALAERPLPDWCWDSVHGSGADAITVGGPAVGLAPDLAEVRRAKAGVPKTPLLVNNGATKENIGDMFSVCDGVVVASTMRVGGRFDPGQVADFMAAANLHR